MSITKETLELDTKRSMLTFIDELIRIVENEPDLILLRMYIKEFVSPQVLMETMVRDILPYKDHIMARDETFFMTTDHLLESENQEIVTDHVEHVRSIWKSGALSEEDKDVVWDWIYLFLIHSEKYVQIQKKTKQD